MAQRQASDYDPNPWASSRVSRSLRVVEVDQERWITIEYMARKEGDLWDEALIRWAETRNR
jgi:predicted P-loop ATPase